MWRSAVGPVERFLSIEASSGIVLIAVAALALLWVNSAWAPLYHALGHVPFGLRLGSLVFERDLHFWINDVLMTVFFFVVGLEIRRELHHGELSDLRRAALPVVAALGGMAAPALIFLALNWGRPSMGAWAIPTATDIAFAVGVLSLLGKRVPPALRILLLALAVIDDVGAIVIITLFYSSDLSVLGLVVMALGAGVLRLMQSMGVRSVLAYGIPALAMWGGAHHAGVHPALSGVVVGLMTPVVVWQGHEAVSPSARLTEALHGWVAFVIMPLFALANAGVPLGNVSFAGDGVVVFLGVALGLGLGKPLGIVASAWLTTQLGLTALPQGMRWSHVGLVGLVGGIGFTMALFVAQLAFPPGPLLETAKLGIILGSAGAALVSLLVGRLLLPAQLEPGAATSASEAEASTER